jgi:hypothetical protein
MKVKTINQQAKLKRIANFFLITLVFSIAYTQEAIYNSPERSYNNQHTKYLQGLAEAGFGFLREDWLANTIDPLPAFTFLVKFTYQYLSHEYMFYIYYMLIMGIYAYSIFGIVSYLFDFQNNRVKYLVYWAIFIFIHTVHIQIFQFDTGRDLHIGVAKQYILGPVFQPCTFGVFLVTSIWLFLYKKYLGSVLLLAIAVTFHPTYFPIVAILTIAYTLVLLIEEKNVKQALLVAFLTFILVLPSFAYMYFTFQPTSAELEQQAKNIIVNFRIPHHSIPKIWLADGVAYIQTALITLAVYLVRKTKLFLILFLPLVAAVSLTIIQLLINNNTLAFIAPWRSYAVLVPISTGIILASAVNFIFNRFDKSIIVKQKSVKFLSIIIITVLFLIGLNRQIELFNYQGKATKVLDFVRQNQQSGQVYLVPPDEKRLRKFRLYTGIPIFINLKSHPYKDVEVIEWYKRVELARNFYANNGDRCNYLQQNILNDYQITHVILEKEQFGTKCDILRQIYRDDRYEVYRIEL